MCEGLEEKLAQIHSISFDLDVRDITSRADWFQAYQYEVPIICRNNNGKEEQIPRPSPRATVSQLEQLLQKYLKTNDSE